ncbi:unnamed protein product [Choristocarpus tenellus]
MSCRCCLNKSCVLCHLASLQFTQCPKHPILFAMAGGTQGGDAGNGEKQGSPSFAYDDQQIVRNGEGEIKGESVRNKSWRPISPSSAPKILLRSPTLAMATNPKPGGTGNEGVGEVGAGIDLDEDGISSRKLVHASSWMDDGEEFQPPLLTLPPELGGAGVVNPAISKGLEDSIGDGDSNHLAMEEEHITKFMGAAMETGGNCLPITPEKPTLEGSCEETVRPTAQVEDGGQVEEDVLSQVHKHGSSMSRPPPSPPDMLVPVGKKGRVRDLAMNIQRKIESQPKDFTPTMFSPNLGNPGNNFSRVEHKHIATVARAVVDMEGGEEKKEELVEDVAGSEVTAEHTVENRVEERRELGDGTVSSKVSNKHVGQMREDYQGDAVLLREGDVESDFESASTIKAEDSVTNAIHDLEVDQQVGDEIASCSDEGTSHQGDRILTSKLLGVMRHSCRLDEAIPQLVDRTAVARNENGRRKSNSGGGVEEEPGDYQITDGTRALYVPWPDQDTRPYDTPIIDFDLPAEQAQELSLKGFRLGTTIISSPFRRCLQTAGVVARNLGVGSVTVHLGMGERMDKVRKELAEAETEDKASRVGHSRRCRTGFSYLDHAGMVEALGNGVKLDGILGRQPPTDESGVQAKERFITTLQQLRNEQVDHLRPVLVVAHGDTLNAAGESIARQIIYQADYCAWALFDQEGDQGHVADCYGVQMIPMDAF